MTDHTDLKARLFDALPKADERETVWCTLQGFDMRALYVLVEAQAAEISRLREACASGWGESTLINMLRAERDAAVADAERWRNLIQNALHNNGGPISEDTTVDRKAYVLVLMEDFDAMAKEFDAAIKGAP